MFYLKKNTRFRYIRKIYIRVLRTCLSLNIGFLDSREMGLESIERGKKSVWISLNNLNNSL